MRLEGGIALLVHHAEADALVGALRRRVADQDRDLELRVIAPSPSFEDGAEERAREALAAMGGAGRDPFDDPRVVRLIRRAAEKGRDPLLQRPEPLRVPTLRAEGLDQRLEEALTGRER